jgi:hypothetical protein
MARAVSIFAEVCVLARLYSQDLPVNGTAQTATSGSRRIGTRVAGALRRIDAAPQYEVVDVRQYGTGQTAR